MHHITLSVSVFLYGIFSLNNMLFVCYRGSILLLGMVYLKGFLTMVMCYTNVWLYGLFLVVGYCCVFSGDVIKVLLDIIHLISSG